MRRVEYRWTAAFDCGWHAVIYEDGSRYIPCDLDLDLFEQHQGAEVHQHIQQRYPKHTVVHKTLFTSSE